MCYGMGLKNGTPEFAQCRMALLQQREANAAQARQNAVNAIQNFNNTVQNNTIDYSRFNTPMAPIGGNRVDVYTHRG